MFKKYEVFEIVQRPVDKNVVRLKQIYALKWREDGKLDKRKIYTITKDFTQVLNKDYNKTYVSVMRLELIQLVCIIVEAQGLYLWQISFILAFLNSDNEFEVYIKQLKYFGEGGEKYVQRLLKILYGTM